MARPREFDRDAALDRAVEVFWERGFDEASVAELVDRMGIERSSLYETFGNKEDLYRAAVARYAERSVESFRAALAAPGSPRAAIEALLCDQAARAGSRAEPTCFLVKTATMRCRRCPDVAATLTAWLDRVVGLLAERLDEAAARGEIALDAGGREAATMLVNALLGAKVLGGFSPDRAALERTLLGTLERFDIRSARR